MSKYFPSYNNSREQIKVELDISNYATKKDIKDITHVDTSSYALKTNLANSKTEVDKIDTDKLKTVPDDLAKLSNVVKNDVVKKTDYNALKTKVDGIDASVFVTKTKFTTDTNALDDKIDKVEKKIPDIAQLATKSSVTRLITEQEDYTDKVNKKIPDISGFASKTELTAVENKIADATNFVKKSDYATEITSIKNDYATNASLDSKINYLKAQHIADEVKKVDDKTKKNSSDILAFENRLTQKEDIVDESQGEDSFTRGFYYYLQKSYTVYECRTGSFKFSNGKITKWKSTGIFNSDLNVSSSVTANSMPFLENNGRMNVNFNGYYLAQNKAIHPSNNKVVNIYIVYDLGFINNYKISVYTIQNALFGAMKITKNATNNPKNKYKRYGICFDSGSKFSKGNITNGKNVIIFLR